MQPADGAVHSLKAEGNACFRHARYQEATRLYGLALEIAASSSGTDVATVASVLLANRSAALLKQGQPLAALRDACACVQVAPTYAKGWLRMGAALEQLQRWDDAARAHAKAAALAATQGLACKADQHPKARAQVAQHYSPVQDASLVKAQARLTGRHLAHTLQRHQTAARRQHLLQQFSQGLSAPTWDPEDWDWRPLVAPSLRLASLSADLSGGLTSTSQDSLEQGALCHGQASPPSPGALSAVDGHEAAATAGGGQQGRDVKGARSAAASTAAVATEAAEREALALAPLLVRCLNLRAELEGPRAALRALSDVARMRTYGEAIAHALRQRPGARVLVISSGCSAALALMAAACGASCVVCMEGSQLTYRMAIQLLQANRHVPGHGNVQVAPVPVFQCRLAEAAGASDGGCRQGCRGTDGDKGTQGSVGPQGSVGTQGSVGKQGRLSTQVGLRATAVVGGGAEAGDSDAGEEAGGGGPEAEREGAESERGVEEAEGGGPDAGSGGLGPGGGCGAEAQGGGEKAGGGGPEAENGRPEAVGHTAWDLHGGPVDVVITDLFDHSVLQAGVLPALRHALTHLAHPSALLVPSRLTVYGSLAQVAAPPVVGLSLDALEQAQWHAQAVAPVPADSWPAGALALSGTFQVLDLCLRSAALGLYGPQGSGCDAGCDVDIRRGCAHGSGRCVGAGCSTDSRRNPPEGNGGAAIGPGQQQGGVDDKVTVNNGTWQETLKVPVAAGRCGAITLMQRLHFANGSSLLTGQPSSSACGHTCDGACDAACGGACGSTTDSAQGGACCSACYDAAYGAACGVACGHACGGACGRACDDAACDDGACGAESHQAWSMTSDITYLDPFNVAPGDQVVLRVVVESHTLHLLHVGTERGAAAHSSGSRSGNGSGSSSSSSSSSSGSSRIRGSGGINSRSEGSASFSPAASPPGNNGSADAAPQQDYPVKPLCHNSRPVASEGFNAAAAPAEQMASSEQLQAAVDAPPAERIRHLALQQWQLQILGDDQRAAAYKAALRHALRARRAAGKVLCIGPSSCLTAMLAVRAGASQAFCCGLGSAAAAELALRLAADNGLLPRVQVLHKAPKLLDVAGDLGGTADVLLLEVDDPMSIGQCARHIQQAATTCPGWPPLTKADAVVLPSAAKVYCMPVQLNLLEPLSIPAPHSPHSGHTLNVDLSALSPYAAKPEVEALKLTVTGCHDPRQLLKWLEQQGEGLQQGEEEEQGETEQGGKMQQGEGKIGEGMQRGEEEQQGQGQRGKKQKGEAQQQQQQAEPRRGINVCPRAAGPSVREVGGVQGKQGTRWLPLAPPQLLNAIDLSAALRACQGADPSGCKTHNHTPATSPPPSPAAAATPAPPPAPFYPSAAAATSAPCSMSAEGQEAAQEARHLSFRVVQPGVCNAVVFWHELSLPGAGGSSGGLGDGSRAAGGSGADVNSGVGDGIGAGGGSGAGCGSRAGGSSGADGNSGAAATPLGGGSGANDGSRDAGDDVTRSQQCSNIGGAAQRSAQSAHPSGVAQDGLSWSPFQAPLPGQAKREQWVQWVAPQHCRPGDELRVDVQLSASAITFKLLPVSPATLPTIQDQFNGQPAPWPLATSRIQPPALDGCKPAPPDTPDTLDSPLDPAWQAKHAALEQVSSALSQAAGQDPLQYRRVAQAAVRLAARPQDYGVDAGAAAAFLMQLAST